MFYFHVTTALDRDVWGHPNLNISLAKAIISYSFRQAYKYRYVQ